MTIAAKLLQINGVKEDIRDAIESFGYDLSSAEFTEYAQYICAIGTPTTIQITADGTNTGTISDDLTELIHVKTDIKNAIESKGIDLTNVPFSSYAQYIYQIPVVTSSPLKFTATSNGSIKWYTSGGATYPNIEFSKNGDSWSTFNSTINVNTGDYVEFRNNGTAWTASSNNSHFSTTGGFDISGNIMSLIDSTMESTTLPVSNCFRCLFTGCGIYSAADLELPATTITDYCYGNMFASCTNLTDTPKILPAMTLTTGCYHQMFSGCTNITTAPVLPAISLFYQCYNQMFNGCTRLNHIEALFTTTPNNNYTSGWVTNVASTGTFVKSPDATWTNTGTNAVPTNWTVSYDDSETLKFTANTAGSTIQLTQVGSPTAITLEKSTDGSTWTSYTVGDTITLANRNDYVMIRGNNSTFSVDYQNYYQFVMTGSIAASGRITSLYDKTLVSKTIPAIHFFESLFLDCTSLTTAPELPETTLSISCYTKMFMGCTSLTVVPVLPATSMNANCYERMFEGCTALVLIPNLPATSLYVSCYYRMFYGCTSLDIADASLPPTLPATTLSPSCYKAMFAGCTSLTVAPKLPASTLEQECYSGMFSDCTSLRYVYCMATNISVYGCTQNWLNNVSSTGEFVKDASMSDWATGASGIPSGWTVQNA